MTNLHAFQPTAPGSSICGYPGCLSPRQAMIHAEPDGSFKKSLGQVIEEASAGVPPFPSEPAPGSPEAVEQAAETIRGERTLYDGGPETIESIECANRLPNIRRWAWHTLKMREVGPDELRERWGAVYYIRESDLLAAQDRLREVTEQLDALAEALVQAESALAIKASLRHGEQERCQRALETVRAALRLVGRLS